MKIDYTLTEQFKKELKELMTKHKVTLQGYTDYNDKDEPSGDYYNFESDQGIYLSVQDV